MIVSGDIMKNGLSESNVELCCVCGLRLKANSVLCIQCGKRIHSRYGEVKRVIPNFFLNLACRKFEWNIGETVEQEEVI